MAGKFGRIDILVNNAGVNTLAHRVTIDDFPRTEWDRILSVDLTGVYEVSRIASAVMKKQKAGRIINIASINGRLAGWAGLDYSSAKAAVIHLTRCAAVELGEQYGMRNAQASVLAPTATPPPTRAARVGS